MLINKSMKIKEKSSLVCVIVKSNKAVPKVCPLKKRKGEKEERERGEREGEGRHLKLQLDELHFF